jgi:hypothetical protein
MMRAALILLLLAAHGCSSGHGHGGGGGGGIDGAFQFLTTDNLGGQDDDPAVAVDAAGNVHVVWFSDRDGTKDLYHVRSTSIDLAAATIAWTLPVQLTNLAPASFPPPTQGDNYPSLFIDGAGTFHLAWFRWNLSNECHILYMKSDGTPAGWAAATVVNVTSGANFDRFPRVVKFAANDLRIYFGSSTRGTPGKNDIFMAQSTDDGATWSAPVAVASLNTSTEQSQFPHVVQVSPTSYLATFMRWKLEPSSDFLDPTNDVFFGQSSDGTTWAVDQVTVDAPDSVNDLTPTVFFDHAGLSHLAWSTTRFGDPSADLVRIPVSARASYPAGAQLVASAVGVADHSPEILAVTVGGQAVFVTVWVRIVTPPSNQVGYRVSSQP